MAPQHDLKILPSYFEQVIRGAKPFEIRRNDRDYKVGDRLLLREFNKESYTGRQTLRIITSVLTHHQFPMGLKDDFVILGSVSGDIHKHFEGSKEKMASLLMEIVVEMESNLPSINEAKGVVDRAQKMFDEAHDRLVDYELSDSVKNEGFSAYWDGQDDGVRGAIMRVHEAMDEPLPLAGACNEPIESARKRIAEMRQLADDGKLMRFMFSITPNENAPGPLQMRAAAILGELCENKMYPAGIEEMRRILPIAAEQLRAEGFHVAG